MLRTTLSICLAALLAACAGTPTESPVLPRPASIRETAGTLRLSEPLALSFDAPAETVGRLGALLLASELPCTADPAAGAPALRCEIADDDALPASEEGYLLTIRPEGITLRARSGAGLFYGIQTLLQLRTRYGDRIPAQEIEDAPRFGWRGMHLDVSRHFFDKEFVKKQLRMMASLKLNRLHWHLVDGAGWRIAIDSYPELTKRAAWRPGATWQEWQDAGRTYCTADTPGAHGGFYSKEDIREVVAYADSLYITIIPEIELPGHSDEVLAAYPALACPGSSAAGELCIGNEASFTFWENVLAEVLELFPSQYIHIGGDEVSTAAWSGCPRCRSLMVRKGMQAPSELQGYAVRRMSGWLEEHGRRAIGWDEVLGDSLSRESAVMVWRNEEWGYRAAAAGYPVVMCPGAHCYFDAYQNDPSSEPQAMSGYLPLEKVYGFDPAPADMPARERVLGVQANLWTEFIPTTEQVEYMLYPRMFALAEVAWSAPERKDFDDFHRRALLRTEAARDAGYTTFDLASATGERPESRERTLHLASGCKVSYATAWSEQYAAGGADALTDGWRGSWSYGSRWQGFLGRDVDVTIDLGMQRQVHEIAADFIRWHSAWIWLPLQVEFELSDDGENFRRIATVTNELSNDDRRPAYETFAWHGDDSARYVRCCARIDRERGGWLFTDEIIVK